MPCDRSFFRHNMSLLLPSAWRARNSKTQHRSAGLRGKGLRVQALARAEDHQRSARGASKAGKSSSRFLSTAIWRLMRSATSSAHRPSSSRLSWTCARHVSAQRRACSAPAAEATRSAREGRTSSSREEMPARCMLSASKLSLLSIKKLSRRARSAAASTSRRPSAADGSDAFCTNPAHRPVQRVSACPLAAGAPCWGSEKTHRVAAQAERDDPRKGVQPLALHPHRLPAQLPRRLRHGEASSPSPRLA